MTDHIALLTGEIPHLRRYARMLLRDSQAADDLVQSSLERALSRLHLWQPDRPLRPWLLTIMHNLHVSAVRRTVRAPITLPLDEITALATPARQDNQMDANRVMAAAQSLPEDQRQAVLLVGVEEMSYKEAAEVLGIPVGTLMSRLHRGREQLRRMLGMTDTTPTLRRVK